jgi:hypothetical protein
MGTWEERDSLTSGRGPASLGRNPRPHSTATTIEPRTYATRRDERARNHEPASWALALLVVRDALGPQRRTDLSAGFTGSAVPGCNPLAVQATFP